MLAYTFYESDARVIRYASTLAERGDSVDVFALRRPGQPSHEVLDGVNVYRVQERTLNERGRLTYALRILRFLVRSTAAISAKHVQQPYHLIHVHSVPDFLVFAAVWPKLRGVPVVLDIHDLLPEFYASKFNVRETSLIFKLLVWIERLSIAFSDHVIVANHIWHQRLLSRSARKGKCTPLCNYPDPKLFFPRPKEKKDGKFIITYPGTLNWHQGVDIAVKAFAKVADRIPDAELHIYGEGPEKESLLRLTQELGLNNRVVFHDFVPTSQIASVMANSDLAIEPKRAVTAFGNEAASTKTWEFMALRVPTIVSKTRIHSYYLNDTIVKFFEPDNVAELADCILLLRRDAELRERLAANAAQFVQANNWEARKGEYLNLVNSLTSLRPRHAAENRAADAA